MGIWAPPLPTHITLIQTFPPAATLRAQLKTSLLWEALLSTASDGYRPEMEGSHFKQWYLSHRGSGHLLNENSKARTTVRVQQGDVCDITL